MRIQRLFSRTYNNAATGNPKGFKLIELLIITGIILLLACLVLPVMATHRRKAKVKACVDNLKQIGVGFRTWALDCGDQYPSRVSTSNGGAREQIEIGNVFFNFVVMSNEIGAPKLLICPEDFQKTEMATFSPRFSNTNVSYFVGADAEDTFPQMLLTGDRNLAFENKSLEPGIFIWTSNRSALSWTKAIHNSRGNVGLADGSVQIFDSKRLTFAAANQSCETNRLAIP